MSARQISIIGGSISGLGAALEILKKDNSLGVTVYEKKTTCSDYTCAGGVSSLLLKEAKMKIPDYTIASKVTSLRIFSVEHILDKYAEHTWKKLSRGYLSLDSGSCRILTLRTEPLHLFSLA